MRAAGTLELAAPPSALRAVLAAPERLAAALPHVDGYASAGEHAFNATIRPATALGEVPLETRWKLRSADSASQRDAAPAVRYVVAGDAGEHRVELDAAVVVRAGADGGSAVAWSVEGRVRGTLASVGQRVLAPVVGHQVRAVLLAADRLAGEAAASP